MSTIGSPPIGSRRSNLPRSTPFSLTIFLDGNRSMPQRSITGSLSFSPATSTSVPGGRCSARLVANGANTPTFSGMLEHGSSMGFDGRSGIVNDVTFWFDGNDYWFSVMQAASPIAILQPSVRFAQLNNISESGSALAGWTYSEVGLSGGAGLTPDKSLAASTDGYWAFQATGHNPATQNTPLICWTYSPGGAVGGYPDCDFVLYGETQAASGNYKCFTLGATPVTLNGNASYAQAAGDYLRTRRSGTNLLMEASKDNVTWVVIHTFASVTARLYPALCFTNTSTATALRHSGLT